MEEYQKAQASHPVVCWFNLGRKFRLSFPFLYKLSKIRITAIFYCFCFFKHIRCAKHIVLLIFDLNIVFSVGLEFRLSFLVLYKFCKS